MDLGNDGGEPRDLPSSPLARFAPFNVVLAALRSSSLHFMRSGSTSVGEHAVPGKSFLLSLSFSCKVAAGWSGGCAVRRAGRWLHQKQSVPTGLPIALKQPLYSLDRKVGIDARPEHDIR